MMYQKSTILYYYSEKLSGPLFDAIIVCTYTIKQITLTCDV